MRLTLLLLALVLLLPAAARGADFTVTATADAPDQTTADGICKAASGECTLRAALQQANALSGADAVAVPAGVFDLTIATALPVTSVLTVTGAGADQTVIDAGGDSGVLSVTGGALTISGVAITGAGPAAAVSLTSGDHVFERVAVRDNTTTSSSGGGLNLFGAVSVQVRDSSVTNNVATGSSQAFGGGISVATTDASLVATRTTIAGNRATGTAVGSSAYGGGVYNLGSTALRHVTLAGNVTTAGSAAASGGNLYTNAGAQSVVLEDSIVTDGTATTGPNCAGKSLAPAGRNIDSGTSCNLPAPHLTTTDPQLDPLATGPGGTAAMVPRLGSPALDAAGGCGATATDQRGGAVPAGAACDIGAAELGASRSVTLLASAERVQAGETVTFVARAANGGPDTTTASIAFELPAGATPVLLEASQGTCSATTCDVGTLARGASASATMVVRLATPGAATLTARVAGSLPDAGAADDVASATATVEAPATPPADTTAPALTGFKPKGGLRARKGGKLVFKLSEAATVKVTVARLRGKKRVRLGAVSVQAKAGANMLKLRRKVGGKRLKRGRLRLTAVATDAAGNASAPVSIKVRVRR